MKLSTILSRLNIVIRLNPRILSTFAINQAFSVQNKEIQNRAQPSSGTCCVDMIEQDDSLVYVQKDDGKDTMTISFRYFTYNNVAKQSHMVRSTHEPLAECLKRIELNLIKANRPTDKKKSSDKGEPISLMKVQIISDGAPIDPQSTENIDAWVEGRTLVLNEKSYLIKTNSPMVESLKLPSNFMADFPAIPLVALKNCSIYDCRFVWHRRISSKEYRHLTQEQLTRCELSENLYWLKVAENFCYQPSAEDVAHHLKLTCYPMKDSCLGLEASTISNSVVQIGPIECPFEKRHSYTQQFLPDEDSLRVVTYNILADLYADSEYSRKVLFGHCPSFALDLDYRRQLLLKELSGYKADIICLQEVDRKEYERTYSPYFGLSNYNSVFHTKGGQVAEGSATLFRRQKFDLVESHKTLLSRLIDTEGLYSAKPENADLPQSEPHPILDSPNRSEDATECLSKFDFMRQVVMSNEPLAKRFLNRHTIIQTSLIKFKEQPENYLLVANTHLYFAPDADHVRLLQGSTCTKYLEFLKDYYQRTLGTKEVGLILCGDMNSIPQCGLYKLLTTGSVSKDLPDWSSNEEEAVRGLEVETNLRFQSAYKNISYTNYTREFNGCLDYIYYECDKLSCEGTIPLPSSEDVTAIDGLPSDVFPSDHLALVANLRYKVAS